MQVSNIKSYDHNMKQLGLRLCRKCLSWMGEQTGSNISWSVASSHYLTAQLAIHSFVCTWYFWQIIQLSRIMDQFSVKCLFHNCDYFCQPRRCAFLCNPHSHPRAIIGSQMLMGPNPCQHEASITQSFNC